MSAHISIIIPTHNRHNYLQRAISYYNDIQYPMLILDSSPEPLIIDLQKNFQYFHLPQLSLPEKLVYGFSKTHTEFVVMCADDDFLVMTGVEKCLAFLQNNRQYAVADGGILFYKKEDIFKDLINFNLLYKTDLHKSFNANNSFDRLKEFFENYRTIFYGIHYTENLKYIYEQCGKSFKNLYLNEYLTALFPLLKGFCKILPFVTAVREFTDTSGDKTTTNLDTMFGNTIAEKELKNYIDCVSEATSMKLDIQLSECAAAITQALYDYAQTIKNTYSSNNHKNNSFAKKIGNFVSKIPVIGLAIVRKRRLSASKQEISVLIKTEEDKRDLSIIEHQILKFRSTC